MVSVSCGAEVPLQELQFVFELGHLLKLAQMLQQHLRKGAHCTRLLDWRHERHRREKTF